MNHPHREVVQHRFDLSTSQAAVRRRSVAFEAGGHHTLLCAVERSVNAAEPGRTTERIHALIASDTAASGRYMFFGWVSRIGDPARCCAPHSGSGSARPATCPPSAGPLRALAHDRPGRSRRARDVLVHFSPSRPVLNGWTGTAMCG